MNAPLYTPEILRLAASLPDPQPLPRVDGAAERRSSTCGSVVRTQAALATDGRLEALSQEVRACAFGQASATLLGRSALGKDLEEVEAAAGDLGRWLTGERDHPGDWPGLEALAPARRRVARHAAILLPFHALAAAMRTAAE